jgi:hypothetical protein
MAIMTGDGMRNHLDIPEIRPEGEKSLDSGHTDRLGRWIELGRHVRGAVRNDCT